MEEKPVRQIPKSQFRVVLNNQSFNMKVWNGDAQRPVDAIRLAINAAGREAAFPWVDVFVYKWRKAQATWAAFGSVSAAKAIAKKSLRDVEYRVDEMHGKCFRLLDIADKKPQATDGAMAHKAPPLFQ